MLRHLSIRNYAIAEKLDLEFADGLTAITGETGAGKSIILGAMSLVLGDRADRDVVRTGSERADISADFDLSQLPQARQWLADNALDLPDGANQCLIRRSVSADGRSRAWINQTPVTLQSLEALSEYLMDIHSQHEHHSLLKKNTQQALLDDYANLQSDTKLLRQVAEQWKQAHQDLETLRHSANESEAQNELARYQLQELEALALGEQELHELDEELDSLTHAESRLGSLQALLQLCRESDEVSIEQALQQALQLLQQASGHSPALQSLEDMFNTALIQVEEAADELTRQLDRIEVNPARLEEVNRRLSDIHQLARKHKIKPEELPELQARLQQSLGQQSRSQDEIQRLEQQASQLQERWQTAAAHISKQRQKAAKQLSKAVNEQLTALAMSDARFNVVLHDTDTAQPQAMGSEQAEFMISTNAGQASKPLARIASGGELSRVSLAIQVITALTSETPTLVFDEVDVGIGGGVARTVGRLLRQLGERSQVLCVTHQPLVASQANHHLLVSKQARNKQTQSQVTELDQAQRLTEIARMLGGEAGNAGPTPESLAHARELVGSA